MLTVVPRPFFPSPAKKRPGNEANAAPAPAHGTRRRRGYIAPRFNIIMRYLDHFLLNIDISISDIASTSKSTKYVNPKKKFLDFHLREPGNTAFSWPIFWRSINTCHRSSAQA